MRVGSLFSGCLGLDLGLEAAGWDIAWVCENDPACQRTIGRQRPDLPLIPDVREIDAGLEPVTLLAGGFPCQDLSNAGKGAGLAGDRSGLWFAMADAIRLLRPELVLIENVPGIFSKMGSRPGESAIGTVAADLAEMLYVGSCIRLSAADVGAPHGRDRVFILAADSSRDVGAELAEGDGREPSMVERVASAGDRDREGRATSGVPLVGRGTGESGGGGASTAAVAAGVRDGSVGRARGGDPGEHGRPAQAAVSAGEEVALAAHPGEDRAGAAADAGSERSHGRGGAYAGGAPGDRRHGGAVAAGHRAPATDAGRGSGLSERSRTEPGAGDEAPANPGGDGLVRLEALDRADRGLAVESWDHADGRDLGDAGAGRGHDGEPLAWGVYEGAVRQWEGIFGRAAPAPTDARGRLNPFFVEWMMGFPEGWTDGEKRTARLRMLGNAVQVQCGEVVGRMLVR